MFIANFCLFAFLILGAFDGLYFHLIKFKLYLRPETQREHFIHSLRAVVLIPMAVVFFVMQLKGTALIPGILLFVFDLVLEVLDVLEEQKSRVNLGGLYAPECLIHILGSSMKFSSMLLILSIRMEDLSRPLDPVLQVLGLALIGGCLLGLATPRLISLSGFQKSGKILH